MTDTRDSFEKAAMAAVEALNWVVSSSNRNGIVLSATDVNSLAEAGRNLYAALTALQAGAGDGKDAARYRWLRDHCNYGVMGSNNPPFSLNCDEPIAEWDAAIDREIGLDKQAIRAREPK